MLSSLPLPIAAFVAGLISFLSPFVLPLVPGYVSMISGAGVDELQEQDAKLRRTVLLNSVMFILCFIFAKTIFNILVWPYCWVAGADGCKLIYTGLLEYFVVQIKIAMFGAAFLSFPVMASQIYMFVAPGLYRHERQAFLP